MSLISSLYLGQNGLSSTSQELTIIGDNIANSSTIGFKAGRASFADMVGESLVGGAGELGIGNRLIAVQKLLTQGAIAGTGLNTDLAISGSGFFTVRTPDGLAYTRNGQFQLDKDGFLVDLQGNRVQGFPNPTSGLGDLPLGQRTTPPQATTTVTIRANLDSREAINTAPFDPNDGTTSNFSTTIQVFDSLGRPSDVTIHYKKIADNTWEWHASTDGANIGLPAGTQVEIGTGGTLTFTTDGLLQDAQPAPTTLTFTPAGATQPQTVALDFGNAISAGGDGSGITQFAQQEGASFLGQDGFAAGDLAVVEVQPDGSIVGTFTNGQSEVIGQIALADFPAGDQLARIGDNLFRQTQASGEPNLGAPESAGRGSIVAGALEQSNVDVANELVRMIIVQRAFQANSKTVSTADQLIGELMQLKR